MKSKESNPTVETLMRKTNITLESYKKAKRSENIWEAHRREAKKIDAIIHQKIPVYAYAINPGNGVFIVKGKRGNFDSFCFYLRDYPASTMHDGKYNLDMFLLKSIDNEYACKLINDSIWMEKTQSFDESEIKAGFGMKSCWKILYEGTATYVSNVNVNSILRDTFKVKTDFGDYFHDYRLYDKDGIANLIVNGEYIVPREKIIKIYETQSGTIRINYQNEEHRAPRNINTTRFFYGYNYLKDHDLDYTFFDEWNAKDAFSTQALIKITPDIPKELMDRIQAIAIANMITGRE